MTCGRAVAGTGPCLGKRGGRPGSGRLRLFLAALACAPALVGAGSIGSDPHDEMRYVPPKQKQEAADVVPLPPLPEDENLVEVPIVPGRSSFSFSVDLENLFVGKEGVVQYSVVISSGSGARSVAVEAIRCSPPAYAARAFATAGGELQPVTEERWLSLPQGGNGVYRRNLRDFFFCNSLGAVLSLEEIRRRLRYPPRMDGKDTAPWW